MGNLLRFGVAVDQHILRRFDSRIKRQRYTNRSEAIRDLMRAEFVRSDWQESERDVVGVITLVYDHHRRGLVNRLLDIQHRHPSKILCSQHVHIDHHECLEVIVAKGQARKLRELTDQLRNAKGVEFSSLTPASGARARLKA